MPQVVNAPSGFERGSQFARVHHMLFQAAATNVRDFEHKEFPVDLSRADFYDFFEETPMASMVVALAEALDALELKIVAK